MEYIDFMLGKLIVLMVLAFIYGFIKALLGR